MQPYLPNRERAYIEPAKVWGYLLAPRQESDKSGFFTLLGFRRENWQALQEALLEHGRANRVVNSEKTAYGVKYAVDGPLEGPNGRVAQVRTVWLIGSHESAPGFVTARPLRRAP